MNNDLVVKGLKEVCGMKFHHIEGGFGEGKRSILVKEIAALHGKEFKHINEAINKNKRRFKSGIDILDLKSVDIIDRDFFNSLGFSNSSISNAKCIYLLSERGYAKLLKILEDDVAWEQYEKLVDGYFNMREETKNISKLSPQLQLLINMELEQKRLQQELTAAREETAAVKEEVQDIRNIIVFNPRAEWRKETNKILNSIARKENGDYGGIKETVYESLKDRAKCRPKVLVKNLKKRAKANGMAKSKVEKLNILDVLENDAKLREVYIAIVKEIAIKYNI